MTNQIKKDVDRMIESNRHANKFIATGLNETGHICIRFVGNADDIEKKFLSVCKESNIPLTIVDVLEEENGKKTNLSDLFDELKCNCSLLYLKNYTKAKPTNNRYKFSCIYKNNCAPNEYGIVTKHNLTYLGTVIISSKDDNYPLDASENSCFAHIDCSASKKL